MLSGESGAFIPPAAAIPSTNQAGGTPPSAAWPSAGAVLSACGAAPASSTWTGDAAGGAAGVLPAIWGAPASSMTIVVFIAAPAQFMTA